MHVAARVLTRRPGREERLRTSAAIARPGIPDLTEAMPSAERGAGPAHRRPSPALPSPLSVRYYRFRFLAPLGPAHSVTDRDPLNVDRLYRLTCGVRHYDWGDPGSPGRPPLIADLLGLPADGRPFAELWIGAHHTLPATVPEWPGAPRLDALLAQHPGPFLGVNGSAAARLPFLLKVLSCVQPLSIQAHPDRQLAARLHALDPRRYPDANHKPEMAVALTPFRALAGFRPPEETRADLDRVPPLRRFFGAVPPGPAWLREAYRRVFAAPAAEAAATLAEARACLGDAGTASPHGEVFTLCARLHPGDRGALSVFFLNLIRLAPGEALFIPPGEPHAYLRGDIIECMAASGNVVRAGLTRRPVDAGVLLEMLSYRPNGPLVLAGQDAGPGVRRYAGPAEEFELEFRGVSSPVDVASGARLSLVLVLEGEVRLSTPRWQGNARRGTALIWPAVVSSLRVEAVSTPARWVRACVPPRQGLCGPEGGGPGAGFQEHLRS